MHSQPQQPCEDEHEWNREEASQGKAAHEGLNQGQGTTHQPPPGYPPQGELAEA